MSSRRSAGLVFGVVLLSAGPTAGVIPDSAPVFIANRGQWPEAVAFATRAGPLALWLEEDGWIFRLEQPRDEGGQHVRAAAVRQRFLGADRQARPEAEERVPGLRHYLQGPDPGGWVRDVPAFAAVRWRELYEGIDVRVTGRDGRFAYDLLLAPGADPRAVVVRCEGARSLTLAADGALRVETELGAVRQAAPLTWQTAADGSRIPRACHYVLLGRDAYGFRVEGLDGELPLVIDPSLEWASYLGGSQLDHAHDLVVDGQGRAVVVGYTSSSSYPLSVGAWDTTWNGGRDGFVTRLAADGKTLDFSTVLGGSSDEEILAVALDGSGRPAVVGWTASPDFPIGAGAFDGSLASGGALLHSDAFVALLGETGGTLAHSTYLGGGGDDIAYAVAAASGGDLYVAGKTASSGFPTTTGAFDQGWGGGSPTVGDAFVLRLAAGGGSLRWSTFLGGAGDDLVNALVPHPDGSLSVAGWTSSNDFPVSPGAFDGTRSGTSDAFVTNWAGGNGALLASTLLGGGSDENALALARDEAGRLLVAGTSRSLDFPVTPGAPQVAFQGGLFYGDGFLVRLAPDLSARDFATLLGGAGDDFPTSVLDAGDGQVVLAGWTASADLPLTPDAVDVTMLGGNDAFLALFDADGSLLLHGSYLGGAGTDRINGLGQLPSGRLLLAGVTSSSDFPVTAGVWDATFGGTASASDAFVARYDAGLYAPASDDWLDLGQGLAGAGGVPLLRATGSLAAGGSGTLELTAAAPSARVILLLGSQAGALPLLGGVLVPWPLLAVLDYGTDDQGALLLTYDAPVGISSGFSFCVQAWIEDPGAPQGWAASNALVASVP